VVFEVSSYDPDFFNTNKINDYEAALHKNVADPDFHFLGTIYFGLDFIMKARKLIIIMDGGMCLLILLSSILVFLWYLFTVTFLK